jgi:hypothetical protein
MLYFSTYEVHDIYPLVNENVPTPPEVRLSKQPYRTPIVLIST